MATEKFLAVILLQSVSRTATQGLKYMDDTKLHKIGVKYLIIAWQRAEEVKSIDLKGVQVGRSKWNDKEVIYHLLSCFAINFTSKNVFLSVKH